MPPTPGEGGSRGGPASGTPASPPGNTAQLRVYEPLAGFSEADRRRWQSYVESARASGRLLDSATALRSEHDQALRAVVGPQLDVPEEHALVRVHDGLSFVCPLDTQRRVWEGLAAFRAGLADIVADAFVPRALADDAEEQLAAWRGHDDARPAHILGANWQVPLEWFVLFDADERTLVLGEGRADPGRSLRYETTMAAARRRAGRARAVIAKHFPDSAPLRGVESVSRWLEEFHPHSRLQLDYGQLVHVLSDSFLEQDTSAADLAGGLAKLRTGDTDAAAGAYDGFLRRWNPVGALENAS